MHKSIRDMRDDIGGVTEQERVLVYMPNVQ
jgi:hypothetical protein